MSGLLWTEDAFDTVGEAAPVLELVIELALSLAGEFVVFDAAIVFRDAPDSSEEAALFEAVEGRIERAMFDAKEVVGNLLDAFGDGETVLGFEGDCAEDEEVEGALEEVGLLGRHLV
jgi:hypothetical protein